MKRLISTCVAVFWLGACEAPPAPPAPPPSVPPPAPTPTDGRPIVATVDGTALTMGPARIDPIGAAAACRDLTADCIQVTGDGDTCIATVKRCATAEPWLEAEACCPAACVDAYQEQRRLGASPVAAGSAVLGSTHECFPGLQEMIRASGGTPRLMPRLTP